MFYQNEKYVQTNVLYKNEARFMGHMLAYKSLGVKAVKHNAQLISLQFTTKFSFCLSH
jgi:formylmethanofuran dehydrogenase subunit E